jgi:nuclear transport factor 2 (NTF2) superfamily protein
VEKQTFVYKRPRRDCTVPYSEWENELDYKLKKEYWAHTEDRIAVRFEYEYRNKEGNGFVPMEMKTGNLMKTD